MSTRITRSIAPRTGISCPHMSGTRPSPSRRAATAGNSASRSGVQVKKTLTTRSGSSTFRSRSSRTTFSAAARIASASFRSACTAPRTAHRRCWGSPLAIARGILPEPLDLGSAEAARAPGAQRAEADGSEPNALERGDLVADRGSHPPDLAVSPSAQRDLDDARRDAADPRGRGEPVVELDAAPQSGQIGAARPAAKTGPVGAGDAVARMHEEVRELAVVGEEDEPRRVGVEAPRRVEALRRFDELHHRLPPPRLAGGRGDAERLVDDPYLDRLRR